MNEKEKNNSIMLSRTGIRVIEFLEQQLFETQMKINESLENFAAEFIDIYNFRRDTQKKFRITESNPHFTRYSEILSELLQFQLNNTNLSDLTILRTKSGQFAPSGRKTIKNYAVEAMKRIGKEIIHVDLILENHNANYPDYQLKKRQIAGEMLKAAKKGRLFISHGGNNFSLIENQTEAKEYVNS